MVKPRGLEATGIGKKATGIRKNRTNHRGIDRGVYLGPVVKPRGSKAKGFGKSHGDSGARTNHRGIDRGVYGPVVKPRGFEKKPWGFEEEAQSLFVKMVYTIGYIKTQPRGPLCQQTLTIQNYKNLYYFYAKNIPIEHQNFEAVCEAIDQRFGHLFLYQCWIMWPQGRAIISQVGRQPLL